MRSNAGRSLLRPRQEDFVECVLALNIFPAQSVDDLPASVEILPASLQIPALEGRRHQFTHIAHDMGRGPQTLTPLVAVFAHRKGGHPDDEPQRFTSHNVGLVAGNGKRFAGHGTRVHRKHAAEIHHGP